MHCRGLQKFKTALRCGNGHCFELGIAAPIRLTASHGYHSWHRCLLNQKRPRRQNCEITTCHSESSYDNLDQVQTMVLL